MYKNVSFAPIPFVRETAQHEEPANKKSPEHSDVDEDKEGAKARAFYEEVLNEKGESTNNLKDQSHRESESSISSTPIASSSSKRRSKGKRKRSKSTSLLTTKLLKAAQEGNLNELELYIDEGLAEINDTDQYGWTALMCASYSGHKEVVKFLLIEGANRETTNNAGDTAAELAENRGHSVIAKLLRDFSCDQAGPFNDQHVKRQRISSFYCDICKSEIEGATEKQHNTSTLHLFNSNIQPPSTSYMIPESNKGFQLMLKTGWDKERGLGSSGQGKKFPVKTILKRDRRGLGSEVKPKSKVTHFGPKDTKAVEKDKSERTLRATTLRKIHYSKKLKREKQREREFRREFYLE